MEPLDLRMLNHLPITREEMGRRRASEPDRGFRRSADLPRRPAVSGADGAAVAGTRGGSTSSVASATRVSAFALGRVLRFQLAGSSGLRRGGVRRRRAVRGRRCRGRWPFTEWLSERRIEDLRVGLGPAPEKDRLARRVARLSTSNLALELLLGRPTVVAAVRGLAHGDRNANARRLSGAGTVVLEREPENSYDANAIRVRLTADADAGYVAREAARGLAAHLDADPDAFDATMREIDADAALLRLEIRAR